MFGLTWPLSLGMKLAAIGLVIAATNVFTAIKVHHYVATEYENILLTEKVAVVTREKKIAVLDTKTLNKALADQRARLAREEEQRKVLDEIINGHKGDVKPWCELNDGELRLWNDENRGFMGDPALGGTGGSEPLPNGWPSVKRTVGESVEK